VETSEIVSGSTENGNVVTTVSGSRYFLSSESVQDMRKTTDPAALKELASARPGATIQLTRMAKDRATKDALEALEALETPDKSKPRATFSLSALFGLGGDEGKEEKNAAPLNKKAAPLPKKAAPLPKKAPRGLPSLSRWRQNRDKSITGLISGTSAFPDGEQITTSPIAKGAVSPGEIVTTSSGSKYFLQ
jgi:hypothetical protein